MGAGVAAHQGIPSVARHVPVPAVGVDAAPRDATPFTEEAGTLGVAQGVPVAGRVAVVIPIVADRGLLGERLGR